MQFKGHHVSLNHTLDGITIKMKDGDTTVSLFLTEMEGAQLMSYLMATYGLTEIDIEESEEEDTDSTKVVH
jgi:hypothetical protein